MNDRDLLITKAQAGDKDAISKLYEMHRNLVYNYINKRVKNAHEAENLTSAVFLRMIEKLDKYKYQSSQKFSNWLITIAHNIIVDEWRKTKRLSFFAEPKEDLLGTTDSAEDDAMIMLSEIDFMRFLDYCTPQQAEVITLKYRDDLSNEQIADRLGTSVGAIKSMQHRAFDNIKEGMLIK